MEVAACCVACIRRVTGHRLVSGMVIIGREHSVAQSLVGRVGRPPRAPASEHLRLKLACRFTGLRLALFLTFFFLRWPLDDADTISTADVGPRRNARQSNGVRMWRTPKCQTNRVTNIPVNSELELKRGTYWVRYLRATAFRDRTPDAHSPMLRSSLRNAARSQHLLRYTGPCRLTPRLRRVWRHWRLWATSSPSSRRPASRRRR